MVASSERRVRYSSREEWLVGRSEGHRIGASDVAKILGVSPYGGPWDVWSEKKLDIEKTMTEQQLADVERGRRWEARVIEDYRHETGARAMTLQNEILVHGSEEWAVASPDGIVLEASELNGWLGGIEAKTDRDPRLWGETGQTIERWGDGSEAIVRPDYALQCYWSLEVSGMPWWDIAVAIPRGYDFPELRIFRLMRDPSIQARIFDKVARWRDDYLVGEKEPDPDGSEAARRSLMRRFPGRADKVVREAIGDERDLLLELHRTREEFNDVERRKKRLTQMVCKAIRDDYGITLGEAKALWIKTKGKQTIDTKALTEAHPEIAEQFTRQGAPFRALRLYGFDKLD